MDTKSSTAKAEAIIDRPGLLTVHCWSKVLSRVLYWIKERVKSGEKILNFLVQDILDLAMLKEGKFRKNN